MAAQAGLCLAWSETPEDTFSCGAAHVQFHYPALYVLRAYIVHTSEPRHEKMCLRESLTSQTTNRPRQPQKLAMESMDIILSRQRTTKALIRLRGCQWYRSVLNHPNVLFLIVPSNQLMVKGRAL